MPAGEWVCLEASTYPEQNGIGLADTALYDERGRIGRAAQTLARPRPLTMPDTSQVVLITGCSTGIGRATAERLGKAGHKVYATARRLDSIADLEGRGCRTLALDVTDDDSMRAAVAAVEEAEGRIDALVNNAGYSQSGAVESIEIDDVRRQFETNVFGLLRMCQLVLPGMRARRSGRILNMSSMGGKLTFPGGGVYHSTKYAVEALSDALRFEVAGFGVEVVLIEPGLIRTDFAETAVGAMLDSAGADGPYAGFNAAVGAATARRLQGTHVEARRRPRDRGARGPEGDRGQAPAHALPGHRVGPRDDGTERRAARPPLGQGRGNQLPASRLLTESARQSP